MGRALVVLAVLLATTPQLLARDRPNLVLLLADDLGWADLGCFGSTFHETPHLDGLRRAGMKFTDAYSSGPNCAPTRACLMTGRTAPHHGIYTVNSGARGRREFRKLEPVPNRTKLDPAEVTLAECLRSAGYATAFVGKWHLGNPPEAGPCAQGFDVNVAGGQRGHPPSYFSPYRNAQLEDGPEGEYLTDRLTDEALDLLELYQDRPFFLYLAYYTVHSPLQAPEERVRPYREKEVAEDAGQRHPVYAAMIESLDRSVGRILERLEQLGIARDTVVVFASDNGGVGGYEELGKTGPTSNAPLRGGKGMLYEGGIRVPMLVRWPGVVAPGTTCSEPVSTLDFFPTFARLGAVDAAELPELEGRDLVPLLTAATPAEGASPPLFWHFPGYLEANSRRGTWRTTPAGAVRDGRWKLVEFFEDDRLELYDLATDLGETVDLAVYRPEVTARLHGTLRAWRERVGARMPTPIETDDGAARSRASR